MVSGNALGGGLFRLPAGGGAPLPFTKLAGREITHRWPVFLPENALYCTSVMSPERVMTMPKFRRCRYPGRPAGHGNQGRLCPAVRS